MSHFLDKLPAMVIDGVVQRIVRAYPRHKLQGLEGFAAELRDQTVGWSAEELSAAVGAAIRAKDTPPGVGSIVKHRPEQQREQREDLPSAACHWCGVEPFTAGYETADGRVLARVRCNCGGREPGWHTPAAKAWKDARDAAAA